MLTTLRRIVLEFSQDTELDSALCRMVTQVKHAMNTDCCSIYIAEHQHQHFILMASDGLAPDSVGRTTIAFNEGLIGLVGQREEPLNIVDAQQHPHFMHAPEVKEEELNAFLGTPIIHQRKVLGVISIQQKASRNFSENEEAFLVTLAAQLATALANVENNALITQLKTYGQAGKPFLGIPGASGVAMAPLFFAEQATDLFSVELTRCEDVDAEIDAYQKAVEQTLNDFTAMSSQLGQIINDQSLDIFEMYKHLLDEANIGGEIQRKIAEQWTAESALKLVVANYVVQFEELEDSYLRERASDIKDLGNRLLSNLQLLTTPVQDTPEQFILLANDVTASMVAEYQHKGLTGIVSLTGSNNSHAAILARALAIPAIMGVEQLAIKRLDKQLAIVDGYSGEIFVSPNEAIVKEYQHLIAEEQALFEQVQTVKDLPSITIDGKAIEIQLNAGLTQGFEHSRSAGAIGVGLYRTEIPFMDRSCFPSEMEQTQLYRSVLAAFPKQSVTMRTLDVGGDKSLPYFPIIEDNPFLGWRGIRITLDHPEIFLVQVRAMLRANAEHNNLEIMLPMIASVSEVDEAKRLINQAYFELNSELSSQGLPTLKRPRVGIMIEVPSVIFMLNDLADKVDFFSVGSNDLTQYLLSVDRNNARVSNIYSSYHPAVLRALNTIAEQAHHHLVPLSLCGELASEPAGALLLLAMGYDKLSMNPHNILKIKWVIRHVELKRDKGYFISCFKFY